MKILSIGLILLIIANIGSVLITNAVLDDPALFGEKPYEARTVFEINGPASDPSHWTSTWGSNHTGKPQHHSQTEVELKIYHSIRGTNLTSVEILANSQHDADALLSLLEKDFSKAYAPAGQWKESNGRQHSDHYPTNRFFWRQRFELLLIANTAVIFCLLISSFLGTRKPTNPESSARPCATPST